jgi:hypothetical protein
LVIDPACGTGAFITTPVTIPDRLDALQERMEKWPDICLCRVNEGEGEWIIRESPVLKWENCPPGRKEHVLSWQPGWWKVVIREGGLFWAAPTLSEAFDLAEKMEGDKQP